MRMYDIIVKKRNGNSLSEDEIKFFIEGYTNGSIPDYQMSALLMAIYFQNMNDEETSIMTRCMAHSGDIVDLSGIDGIKVDKHSTGGVGDKDNPDCRADSCRLRGQSGQNVRQGAWFYRRHD